MRLKLSISHAGHGFAMADNILPLGSTSRISAARSMHAFRKQRVLPGRAKKAQSCMFMTARRARVAKSKTPDKGRAFFSISARRPCELIGGANALAADNHKIDRRAVDKKGDKHFMTLYLIFKN
jgi:hypothetical protein